MQDNNVIGKAIKNARHLRKLSAVELCKLANIPRSSLSDWENGKTQPSAKSFLRILEVLKMSALEFINLGNKDIDTIKVSDTIGSVPSVKIPVLGSIPAGIPIEAIQDILDYEEITQEMANTGEFFGLKVKGDSMSPTIQNGDVVIVRKQADADSGKICVVMINGNDATLKQIKKDLNGIYIVPLNPSSEFKTTFYSNSEVENLPVKVIGVAVEIRRSL